MCLNIGTEAYPKYRDKGCHNAVKCLELAAESRGKDAKEALSKYKNMKRKQWVFDVLRVRVCTADDPPLPEHLAADEGLASAGERKDQIRSYMEAWRSTWSTETIEEVVYLTKRQFLCWFKLYEGYTATEAQSRWDLDENNPEIKREMSKAGELTLAVAVPKTCAEHFSTEFRARLECEGGLRLGR